MHTHTPPNQTRNNPLVILVLFLTLLVVLLDRMVGNFLGPFLVEGLHLQPSQIGLIAGATGICWALSALVFGAVSDRIGRRKVLIPAIFLFSVASWLSGLAQNFEQLLLTRALLGLAEGPCFAVIMALVEEYSASSHRARNVGIVNSAGPFAAGIAPIFASQVAVALGWRWGFYAAAIPGLAMGVMVWIYVQEPIRYSAPSAVKLEGLGSLLRNGSLWLCLLGAFGFVTSLMAFVVFAPLFLTQVMQQEARTAGLLMGAAGFGGAAWSFFGTGIADRIGRKPALLFFSLLNVASILLFMVPGMYASPYLLAVLAFALSAGPAAAALIFVLIPAEVVPRHHVAAAIGFAGIGSELLGGSLGPAVGGMLAQQHGLSAPMLLAAAGGAVVVVVALLIRETLVRPNGNTGIRTREATAP